MKIRSVGKVKLANQKFRKKYAEHIEGGKFMSLKELKANVYFLQRQGYINED